MSSTASQMIPILLLILDPAAPVPVVEEPFPDFCEAPYVEPSPGFGVKGSCKGRGLKAVYFIRKMTSNRTLDRCETLQKFKLCGYVTDPPNCFQFNQIALERANKIEEVKDECAD